MDDDDKKAAKGLADGLRWLANAGREGAKLLKPMIDPEADNLEEAVSWLADIGEGRDL